MMMVARGRRLLCATRACLGRLNPPRRREASPTRETIRATLRISGGAHEPTRRARRGGRGAAFEFTRPRPCAGLPAASLRRRRQRHPRLPVPAPTSAAPPPPPPPKNEDRLRCPGSRLICLTMRLGARHHTQWREREEKKRKKKKRKKRKKKEKNEKKSSM